MLKSFTAASTEFKLSFIVAFQQRRTVRVIVSEMHIVLFWVHGGVAALFTHVHLGASLLVAEFDLGAVNLFGVTFQRAALGEGLVAPFALVWSHTCYK